MTWRWFNGSLYREQEIEVKSLFAMCLMIRQRIGPLLSRHGLLRAPVLAVQKRLSCSPREDGSQAPSLHKEEYVARPLTNRAAL